ncbi:MAG: flagellar motor switch protein FliG [SAR324 cluster bacterium]|nr:flagellar motor switch protein FliG [SAR324 cluster bacterium]
MAFNKFIPGPRKAAILLLALGEEVASDIMRSLSEAEIQQVGYFMTRLTEIDQDELDFVLNDFYNKTAAQDGSFLLSAQGDFVRNALSKAFGEEKAKKMLENLSENAEGGILQSLKWLDPRTIAQFISNEHPQTIALILAHMDTSERMGVILKCLPESIQADVAYRIAILESIPPGVISEIDEVLTHEMQTAGTFSTAKVGGTVAVAEALNSMEKAVETRILSSIEEANPDLAENIRELMFTFEDLIFIDSNGVQVVLSEVSQSDLVLSLKTASEQTKELILRNMSQRQQGMVKDDLSNLGPTRVSEVEAAQQKIVKVVRQLEEEGRIFIPGRRGGEALA